MEGLRTDSATARLLFGSLETPTFTLIDVGCAGGLDVGWTVFGDRLRAFAFDASASEVARLTGDERRPNVHDVAAKVGPPPDHPLEAGPPRFNWWRRNPWDRLAVARRQRRLAGQRDTVERACAAQAVWPVPDALRALAEHLPPGAFDRALSGSAAETVSAPSDARGHAALIAENRWLETTVVSDEAIVHLPSFLAVREVDDIDFIKIDIDGPDYGVLTTLQDVILKTGVLALSLEVNFFGDDAPHHHTFHNTDRLMRRLGFSLYGLTVRPYGSAALPRAFANRFASSSVGGRPLQGDAFYARDTGWLEPGAALPTAKLVKLAAIFALFDLPDQAAELLIRHRAQLEPDLKVERMLDTLTEEAWPGRGLSHGELIERFDADDAMFFPSPGASAP